MPAYEAYLPRLYHSGPDRADSNVEALKVYQALINKLQLFIFYIAFSFRYMLILTEPCFGWSNIDL